MITNILTINDYRNLLIKRRRLYLLFFFLSLAATILFSKFLSYPYNTLFLVVTIFFGGSLFFIGADLNDEATLKRHFLEKYEERNLIINLKARANLGISFIVICVVFALLEDAFSGLKLFDLMEGFWLNCLFILYRAFQVYYRKKM